MWHWYPLFMLALLATGIFTLWLFAILPWSLLLAKTVVEMFDPRAFDLNEAAPDPKTEG